MRKSRPILLGVVGSALAAGLSLFACGGEGFDPQSRVEDSVRLFAVRADKPYAKPGETVTLEALMTDARKDRTRELKLYWLPFVCMNPEGDVYYLCFVPQASSAGAPAKLIPVTPSSTDGGADASPGATSGSSDSSNGGGLGGLPSGTDSSPYLPQGPTFSFQMPLDAVEDCKGTPPYGLAMVFNIACAGQVRFTSYASGGSPQQLPIICSDEAGNALSPKDYVIGISRVYSYPDRVNTNPVIDGVTFEGNPVDLTKGITVDCCTTPKQSDCEARKIDVHVPDSSWEDNQAPGSENLREQIWADYYSDQGTLESDARLLFDTRTGRVSDSAVKFRPFEAPGQGHVWIVVHDNRGGATWSIVPIRVQ